MNVITRRNFLASLALGSTFREAALAMPSPPNATRRCEHLQTEDGCWCIARQNRERGRKHVVDFWSKPVSNIEYASQLPPEIVRGSLWYESDALGEQSQHLSYINSILACDRNCWGNDLSVFLKDRADIREFRSSLLRALDRQTRDSAFRRTALLALDSRGPHTLDLDWADMLPTFRRLYHRVIGHFHIQQRGFHHWKQSKALANVSDFERIFTKTAAQCDAVILTSPSLIENDAHLSARVSTEFLAGELMRRFGQVLLDEKILAEVVPDSPASAGRALQSRVFALGSAGAGAMTPRVETSDLLRQRELVFSSFGKPVLQPLLIATRADRRCAESVRDQIAGSNILVLETENSRHYHGAPWFEFATLWPFDPNYGPWPDLAPRMVDDRAKDHRDLSLCC